MLLSILIGFRKLQALAPWPFQEIITHSSTLSLYPSPPFPVYFALEEFHPIAFDKQEQSLIVYVYVLGTIL